MKNWTMVILVIGFCALAGTAFRATVFERLKAPVWSLQNSVLRMGELEREFSFYKPDQLLDKPSLIFLLHGSDGFANRLRYLTNYEFEKQVEARRNAILVYPQGFEGFWNDCRSTGTYSANLLDINEKKFFQTMIDFFRDSYGIDGNKVYAAGYSNGGHMAYKLALETPHLFRGIAAISANLPEIVYNDCAPTRQPTSVLVVNGKQDPINPSDGGWVIVEGDSSRGKVISSKKTYEYWKNLLECDAKKEEKVKMKELTIQRVTCENLQVQHLLLNIGGHTIPLKGRPAFLPSRLGNPETNFNTPEYILDFFEQLSNKEQL